MTKPLCIYHGNCLDGFTAAWAVWKALPDCEFHAGIYQNPPPDVTDRDVIIVDFSYKYDVLVEMSYKARSILILDHHKSAQEDLARLPLAKPDAVDGWFHGECAYWCQSNNMPHIGALFDMERSGAGITWDYFHPDNTRPEFVNYVEDRDLWRFDLPKSREVNAALFSFKYDFETWDYLSRAAIAWLADAGEAIERKHFKDIAELADVVVREMEIHGHRVLVANVPYTLTSDMGHRLAEGRPFAACYWDTPEGRVFSLRSHDDGLDVSEIAKAFGGGGHRSAAGFRVSFEQAANFEV